MAKKILALLLTALILFSILGLAGCTEKASKYTEEEHIQRVTERVEKLIEGRDYTGFKVYPLYNENDELTHFLVELEPAEFFYVLLQDEPASKIFSFLGASTSMYRLLDTSNDWSPYTLDETNSQPYPDTDKCWKLDENGKKIVYDRSHFFVAGIENEPRYLLHIDQVYIPAVKQGEKFLNLVSMEEFEIIDGQLAKKQAYALIFSPPPKIMFDL